ncbi:MAG: hypothetical protein NC132_02990 [Corallococcus sp.]|nr:hypothetical protein [Corallococcus sp.]MCM1359075.1 hypothetical protein [Corallococcus sp.]MCM1395064.1 hypothetical protein [Corallococcus sp.]
MNFTNSLLYLLLLYAVLDKDGKLSLTTGLIAAFAILLFNCYFGNRCCGGSDSRTTTTTTTTSGNGFGFINNI